MDTSSDLYPPLKEWVKENVRTDFIEAVRLTVEESLKDPAREPFKSLYTARRLFQDIQQKMESECPEDLREEEDFRILSACVLLELGMNYINTEEPSNGERSLETCLHRLEGVASKVKTASVSIQAHNQLGVLWGNRSEQQKALEYLLKAKAIYESHIALPAPITDTEWILGVAEEDCKREKQMEANHTLTLFYLAQVYGNLKQTALSAQYCQTTLSRQLESGEYDPVEWSLNCATLSQYHVTSEMWPQARHCLASSSRVLQNFRVEKCGSSPSDSTGENTPIEDPAMAEKVAQTESDISRCWIKYCLALMLSSINKLQEAEKDKDSEEASLPKSRAQGSRRKNNVIKPFCFEPLETSDIESSVPDELVCTYSDARTVFLTCQKHINTAKSHFTLESFASEHSLIVQDHSQAYKLLAFFEASAELKCRMHKRRVDMLNTLLKELNPRFYLSEHKELLYEVAETLSEMADLKTVSGSESPNQHIVDKINKLVRNAIGTYQQLLATYYEPDSHRLPEKLDSSCVRSVLTCRLNIARLHSKLIAPSNDVQVCMYMLGHA